MYLFNWFLLYYTNNMPKGFKKMIKILIIFYFYTLGYDGDYT